MVGLSKKRVFPKTKGDSITGQDRAQKHCDFRFSQIEKKSKVAVLQLFCYRPDGYESALAFPFSLRKGNMFWGYLNTLLLLFMF